DAGMRIPCRDRTRGESAHDSLRDRRVGSVAVAELSVVASPAHRLIARRHRAGVLKTRARLSRREPADDSLRNGRPSAAAIRDGLPVAELAKHVRAPTIERTVRGDGARGARSGGDAGERESSRDKRWRRLRDLGAVAQLAAAVQSPAVRLTVDREATRVLTARADLLEGDVAAHGHRSRALIHAAHTEHVAAIVA